jgi:hypothetical protein
MDPLALTLGIAGPREEEVQSQAVVQEQDLNEEPAPRAKSLEVEILLTQPASSRRRPREEQEQYEGSREDRLIRHPRFRRLPPPPPPPSNTNNFPLPQSQATIVSFPPFHMISWGHPLSLFCGMVTSRTMPELW